MRSLPFIQYHNQISPEDSRYTICNEIFVTIPTVIYTIKNFYLLNEIDKKIEMMKAAGLVEKWHFDNIDKSFMKLKKSNERKVLTMQHLLGSFHLLCFGYFISLIVFIGECFKSSFKKFLH
jgi:hypothetical protein